MVELNDQTVLMACCVHLAGCEHTNIVRLSGCSPNNQNTESLFSVFEIVGSDSKP